MDYAIRVTRPYLQLIPFIECLEKVCERFIIYEHTEASNVHIHGLLLATTVSTDTLKNYIKKALNVVAFPKADWSFKTADKDYKKYITYMSKGKLEAKASKAFAPAYIQECKAGWVEPAALPRKNDYIQYKLVQENPQQQKRRKNDMLNEMISKYKNLEESKRTDENIKKIIIDVIKESKELITIYKVMEYYDTLLLREAPGRFCQMFDVMLQKRFGDKNVW